MADLPSTAPTASAPGGSSASEPIGCAISDAFAAWMATAASGALAITTYQAGKVAMVGWDGRQVTLLLRDFDKPLGLTVGPAHPTSSATTSTPPRPASPHALALATRNEVTVFADATLLAHDYLEDQRGRYDALYLPRATYHTGDINAHDLAFDDAGELWVVNTRFCCLARLSRAFSFEPVWKPPFVSEIVPEDRCHLNGLAIVNGKPKYVTCLGETDTVGGWRPDKASGGVVVDIEANAVVTRGLSMPHSPRWREADGRLWVLNSGTGEVWRIDPRNGTHDVVCALPGYLRGLGFVPPHYALVGLCQIRERHIFGDLPVQQRFPKLLCAVAVIDTRSGHTVAMLEFTSGVQELFDVRALPANIRRPMILNLHKEATRQAFTAPAFAYWLRPSNEIRDGDGDAPPGGASRP